MKDALEFLIAPTKFLQIKSRSGVRHLVCSLCAGVAISLTAFWFGGHFFPFKPGGLVERMLQMISTMIGFYVAGLGLIASISSKNLSAVIGGKKGDQAYDLLRKYLVETTSNGKKVDHDLTQKEYICMMFGYLSFLSIVVYILGTAAIVAGDIDGLSEIFRSTPWAWVRPVLYGAYGVLLTHLAIVTLMSLSFLSIEVHRNKGGAISRQSSPPNEAPRA